MATERLTTRRIETARPQSGRKLLEIRDELALGLELRVTASGSRSWSFTYARRLDGKWRRMSLGKVQGLSLEAARAKAGELRRQVDANGDPASSVQERREAVSLREIVERRLGRPAYGDEKAVLPEDESLAESTRENYRAMLNKDVLPKLGHMPANEITADMIVSALDKIEGRNRGDGRGKRTADHAKSAIGSTYKWAKRKRLVQTDPTIGIAKRQTVNARKRIVTDAEVATLFRALSGEHAKMSQPMRCIVLLGLLTGQRRAEVAGIRRGEVHLDGTAMTIDGRKVEAPVWIIPGDEKKRGSVVFGRTKNGQEQIVPLSDQAAAILRRTVSDSKGDWLFPSGHTVKAGKAAVRPHINEDSVTKAMIRVRTEHKIDDVTIHDLRRAIGTNLGEMGFRPDVIDRVLNHAPVGVTRQHYDFSIMIPDVRRAMQAWADRVDTLAQSDRPGGSAL